MGMVMLILSFLNWISAFHKLSHEHCCQTNDLSTDGEWRTSKHASRRGHEFFFIAYLLPQRIGHHKHIHDLPAVTSMTLTTQLARQQSRALLLVTAIKVEE